MTGNVAEWFIPKFEERVEHEFQQKVNKLGDTVSGGGTFVGDKCYFPRIGVGEAYDSARFAQLALQNFAQDWIEVSAKPRFIAFGLWDPDKHKYSINTANEYAQGSVAAIYRAEERCILDALAHVAANGTPKIGSETEFDQVETIGDYDTPADLDLIAEAVTILGENEAFEGQSVTAVTPIRHSINMSLDPYMAKSDMKENLPWNRIGWRTHERLPNNGDGTGVDLFVYAKSALVSAYNDKITKINDRDGRALTDVMGYWVQVGARARNAKGIVRIRSKKSFSLYRKATPIIDMAAA